MQNLTENKTIFKETSTFDSMSITVIFESKAKFKIRIGRSGDTITGDKKIVENYGIVILKWFARFGGATKNNQDRIDRLKRAASDSSVFDSTSFMAILSEY